MKELFIVLLVGFAQGFHFLRTPLTPQRWIFAQQQRSSSQTRLSYAMDDDNSRMGNTTRGSWIIPLSDPILTSLVSTGALSSYTIKQMKELLVARRLPVSGNKAELIERLENYVNEVKKEEAAAPKPQPQYQQEQQAPTISVGFFVNVNQTNDELFLFRRDNDNPTQEQVDDYFLSEPNPSPEEVVQILQRTVKWKKNHKIDVLTGDKLSFVMSSLESMLFQLTTEQLHNATVRTLMCMQVIPLADIERSGSSYSIFTILHSYTSYLRFDAVCPRVVYVGMLRIALHLLHLSRQRNINFTAIGVARMCYGLVKMSSLSPEIRDIISVLIDIVHNSQEQFGAQAISTALYGLKGMNSEYFEVRMLLNELTNKVKNCREKLRAVDIGLALYGLQSMKSKYDEVQSLLAVLLEKTKDCHKKMTAQEVCMALYGLKGMSCRQVEVRSMLVWLTERAKECPQEFGPHRVAMSLYGLQYMSSEYTEIRQLLRVLTKKMMESEKKYNAATVIMASHGLQMKSSKHSAVRKLVMVLADKIAECEEQLSPQKYRQSMVWLQDMQMEHAEARKLFIALTRLKSEDKEEENSLVDEVSRPTDFLYTYGLVQNHNFSNLHNV